MAFSGKSNFEVTDWEELVLGLGFSDNDDSKWGLGNWVCEERNLGFKKEGRRIEGSGEELSEDFIFGFLQNKKRALVW